MSLRFYCVGLKAHPVRQLLKENSSLVLGLTLITLTT